MISPLLQARSDLVWQTNDMALTRFPDQVQDQEDQVTESNTNPVLKIDIDSSRPDCTYSILTIVMIHA